MKMEKLTGKGDEHLYRHPKNGRLYVRVEKTGHGELNKSTRTSDFRVARRLRDEMLRSFLNRDWKPSHRQTCLELFDSWVVRRESAEYSDATATSIKASRKWLEGYFETMFPENVTAEWWEKVFIPQTKRANGKGRDRKFFNDWKWLKAFLNHLHRDGVIKQLPRLVNPDPKTTVGKVYSDYEVSLLITCSSGNLRLMILMASTMGMRRGEIVFLDFDRVDLEKDIITLRPKDTKTRKGRKIAISPPVLVELKKFKNTYKSGPVFRMDSDQTKRVHKDGFRKSWAKLKKELGIVGRFHDLRHTFLTNAFKAPNANAALICAYAGLSLEVAIRVYLHFNEEHSRFVSKLVSYTAVEKPGSDHEVKNETK